MRVAVLGAGIAGLVASLGFARAGHDVTLVERDGSPPPEHHEQSFLDWDRPGVPQRRLVHGFIPFGRRALLANLPDLAQRLYAMGAHDVDLLESILARQWVASDEDLVILRSRRTVFEWTLRKTVRDEKGVTLLAGEVVAGLVAEPMSAAGVPRVTGVRLKTSGVVAADLVVDAMGRGSGAARWLLELGVRGVAESRQPCGVIYFTRFYERQRPGFPIGFRAQLGYGVVSASAGDGQTFDITFFVRTEEPGLRRLRDADAFERAVRAVDGLDSWREGARPIGPVAVMGAVENCLRHFIVGGRPCVSGFIAIGDSLSLTNPTLGRGMSMAFHQAIAAVRIDWSVGDLEAGAVAYHADVDPLVEASYADAVEADRIATAAYAGDPAALEHPRTMISRATPLAAVADHELYRAIVRHTGLLSPPGSLFVEPWISRTRALLTSAPVRSAGPDMERMLNLLQS
jgi:2-polyprenyl-6-methoxyphenol hydroxylase-like FAD-dependent oxidoreductase